MDGVLNAKMLPLPKPELPVSVEINGEMAEVTYAGGAPGEVAGMLQVNARIPADVPAWNGRPGDDYRGGGDQPGGVTVAIK